MQTFLGKAIKCEFCSQSFMGILDEYCIPSRKKKKRMTNVDITTYVWGLAESVFAHEY